jgi:hypothetical protein
VRFGVSHEVNSIGPKYISHFLGIRGSAVAEIKADLCLDCGTIIRLHANLEELPTAEWDKR